MQVLSRNPQKGLDCSFLLKMEAELLHADVVDDCQHTIPWRNHTRTIRCWHRKCIRRAHKATPEEEFKSRPRTHETRSTFFLFHELRIQKLSSRRKIEDCETKAQQLCLWRSFEAFTDFKLPFFARFGLKVSSHKFTQFLPSKPLFDSRNASHQ